MSDGTATSTESATQPPLRLPIWRRALSIVLFCVAFAILLPVVVLACGLAFRYNTADFVGLISISVLVTYPAILLIAVAAIVRWHRSPRPR